MLNINFFTFNAFGENTYIINNEKKHCWIVDPGMYGAGEITQMLSFINDNQFLPQAILNTHTHIDHIFGIQALIDKYNIPYGIHEDELQVLKMAAGSATLFGFNFSKVPIPTFYIKPGTPLMLDEDILEVFYTPGHSPGSISFYYPKGNWVISGDVLFADSIGRTDLPGGSFETLAHSIRTMLFTLPGETSVLPGHGPSTTIAHEKKHNPFLQ
jgi:glyoxylase-like metal-dependent hydrolase (beta-lactamase superfamily II)